MKNYSAHMSSMNLTLRLVFGVVLLFGISSCKKKDEDPFVNKEPFIELVNVTPVQAVEFSDSLIFTVHYRDNDGDLGENTATVKNLFLTDNRVNVEYAYRIQQLAPSGSNVPIEGDLLVVLKSVARTDTTLAQQVATFSLYVVDRAGHKSNTVVSVPVTIAAQ